MWWVIGALLIRRNPICQHSCNVQSFPGGYTPGKTRTVTLFNSIGRYLKRSKNLDLYYHKLLHNHKNGYMLSMVKVFGAGISSETRQKHYPAEL